MSEEEKAALNEEAGELANKLKSDLEGLLAMFPESPDSASIMALRAVLSAMISDVDTLTNAFSNPTAIPAITEELKKLRPSSARL